MRIKTAIVPILVLSALACGSQSWATDQSGQSSSYSLSSNLTASGFSLTFAPIPTASGSAPAPYNTTNTADSFAQGTAGDASLSTATLSANAFSNVDGTPGSMMTTAFSYADNVSFELGGNVILFTAGVVASYTDVEGDYGAFNPNGYADFSDASLFIFGTQYDFSTEPDPNTVMYNSGGLEVISNDQIVSGNGVNSRGISITALDFKFTNFVENGTVVNGEVMFDNSQAEMLATPEPITWIALGGFALAARRRARKT